MVGEKDLLVVVLTGNNREISFTDCEDSFRGVSFAVDPAMLADGGIDMLIVTPQQLMENRDIISSLRSRQKNLFFPVLLVFFAGDPLIPDSEKHLVDDLLYIPGEKSELPARVNALLDARRRSLFMKDFASVSIPVKTAMLSAQEELVSYAIDLAKVGVYQIDEQGYIRYVNQHASIMTGYSREELLSMKIYELDPAFSESNFHDHRKEIRKSGSDTFLTRHKSKNGTIIPVEVSVTYFKYRDVDMSLSIARDISERILWEEQLISREEQLRRIIVATGAGTWSWNIHEDLLEINERWAAIIGYSKEELTPCTFRTWERLVHPDDIPVAAKEVEKNLNGESDAYSVEIRMRHKNGNWVWISSTGKVTVKDQDGKPVKMEGTHLDITERVEAQKDLNESREMYRHLVEDINDVPYQIDNTGRFIYVSPAVQGLTGFPDSWYQGKFLSEAIFPDDREKAEAATLNFLNGGPGDPVEIRLLTNHGDPVWARASSKLIHENGIPTGIRGIVVDIHLQKITEMQLIRAREKAEESDRLKTAFLANLSHEIRTPMNGIIGFAHLLRNSDPGAQRRDLFLDHIQKSADRMLALIDDLVDISLIDSSEVNLYKEAVILPDLIDELTAKFSPAAKEKKLLLVPKITLSSGKEALITDRAKLHTILSGLIKNAIKFTVEGEVSFGVTGQKNGFEFYVSDTGCGIDPEIEPYMFERFRKADRTPEGLNQGPGLGLSIARAFVVQLGGELNYHSLPGKGTRFTFSLSDESQAAEDRKTTGSGYGDLSGAVILVAEDDEVNMLYVREVMKDHVSRVLTAEDGETAVKLALSEKDLSLVLMDIKLPVKSGLTAAKEIKAARPGLPVIAYTACARPEDQAEALKAGCDGYISKPAGSEEILGTIARYVSSAK